MHILEKYLFKQGTLNIYTNVISNVCQLTMGQIQNKHPMIIYLVIPKKFNQPYLTYDITKYNNLSSILVNYTMMLFLITLFQNIKFVNTQKSAIYVIHKYVHGRIDVNGFRIQQCLIMVGVSGFIQLFQSKTAKIKEVSVIQGRMKSRHLGDITRRFCLSTCHIVFHVYVYHTV